MILVNGFLAVLFIVHYYVMEHSKSTVSIYVMAIFAFNMTGYATRYIITKVYYAKWRKLRSETLTWTCLVYLVLWAITAVVGLYYFAQPQKSSHDSPSVSRHFNQECTVFFFDKHDIWHFLSSSALFFCFMFLLTLDDNNTCTPWRDMPVF